MNDFFIVFQEIFKQDFMIKALITGIFIAISCSLLGVFLVLKNMSLIGDGLAHVSFAAIAIGLLVSDKPIIISIPIVIVASFLVLLLKEKAKIDADATIGLLSSFSIAVGVIIASVAKGFNIDLFSYLFGSILFISPSEMILSGLLAIILIVLVLLFYNDLFSITFDENFAKISGIKVRRINYLLSVLISVTIVLGIRIVGTMLISSLIVFPSVSALQISKGFKRTLMFSVLFSMIAVVLGIIFSYILNVPTGALIVVVNAIIFLITLIIRVIKRG
ncbi:MAG: metal ABC transporter permease [Fusobacteriaceae bacterium]|nr:metal ABC transporter permease [Fusobacteriaceae bacterium]MBP6466439.1 metal ABC transporter permease [Fusobacteriaceae bacterium]MBP9596801.1 metal ABC transporter permease [Fusobacteriaceae bacterium]MBU9917405.1 metal ABC transporter permease [Fusobacteriaceae bacterium]